MNLTPKTFIVLAIASLSPCLGTPVQANDDVKKINSANQALVDGNLDDPLVLIVAQGRRFTGGSDRNNSIHAARNIILNQRFQSMEVD